MLGNVAAALDAEPLAAATDVVRVLVPTDGLWRGVVYGLQPPLVVLVAATGGNAGMMQGNPFFASAPPPLAFVAWSAAWTGLVLLTGIAAFRRREL